MPARPATGAAWRAGRQQPLSWSSLHTAHHEHRYLQHRYLPASRIPCHGGLPASRNRYGRRYGTTTYRRRWLSGRPQTTDLAVEGSNPSIAPLTLASAVVAYRLLSSDCRAFAACSPLIRRPPAGTWTRSCGDEPSWTLSSRLDQELLARASRCARSASFEVSSAARSNSARASMERPSLASRSPRTLGSRW